jgi:hypothetical protein
MAYKYSTGITKKILEHIAADVSGFEIDIYSGTQPTSPDAKITLSSSVKLLGTIKTSDNLALHFAPTATNNVIDKSTSEIWQFTAVNSGTAGWLRIRLSDDTGLELSETALRIDGTFGYGSADATIEGSGNNIESGKVYTINQCAIHWGS